MLCFHNPQQIEFNGDWNVGKVIHLFIVQFPNWEWNNRLFVLEDHQRVHFNLLFFLTLKDLFENERVHKHLLEILKKLNLLTILSSPNFCFEKRYFVQVLLIWFFLLTISRDEFDFYLRVGWAGFILNKHNKAFSLCWHHLSSKTARKFVVIKGLIFVPSLVVGGATLLCKHQRTLSPPSTSRCLFPQITIFSCQNWN